MWILEIIHNTRYDTLVTYKDITIYHLFLFNFVLYFYGKKYYLYTIPIYSYSNT